MQRIGTPSVAPGPLNDLFNRIDENGDGNIDHSEFESFAGAASGDSWGAITVANTLMDKFDDPDRNGQVTRAEFRRGMRKTLVEYFTNTIDPPADFDLPTLTAEWFTRADGNQDGVVTTSELAPAIQARLESQGMPPMWAERAARLLSPVFVAALDRDRGGGVSSAELNDVVTNVVYGDIIWLP